MPSAMSLHFESDHPFIAVPLEGETIQDLQIQIAKIVENPYDMMAFDAGYFNGAINLSQLWNALLYIAREGANPSVLFSCDKSKLPEMYQTDRDYGSILRSIMQYLGVSDCRLEEGSMRCDANISIRPVGSTTLGTKTEIKNINSFSAVQKGIEYEAVRQAQILEEGGTIQQATRGWDEAKGVTILQRVKEGDSDYRYFPEPDLIPIEVSPAYIEEVRKELPEMPDARCQRFQDELGLSEYDANLLTLEKQTADYFETVVKEGVDAKEAANWMLGEFAKKLNEEGIGITDSPVAPTALAGLLKLIAKGTISGKIAKKVLPEMWTSGKSADDVVKEQGLVQITDTGALEELVQKVIAANPQSVEDYKAGKKKAIGFLVGQIMKETKGRANPGVVNQLLTKNLQ